MTPQPPETTAVRDSRLFRLVLRLVPRRWRDSVSRDLREDARRAGRRGWTATTWLVAQTLFIVCWIAGRATADRWQARVRWGQTADGVVSDVRLAMRGLARQFWSTATIVATLALGMSAPIAVFAVFNHVLFRPIPGVGEDADLATVYFQPADRALTFSTAPRTALPALRATGAFTALGAATDAELAVLSRPGADPTFARVEFVTDGYFEALQVRLRAGRLFSTEDVTSRRSVAVISERWWQRELGGDLAALGRTITVNREPAVVVGVLRDYRGWSAVRIGTVDVWMPIDAPVAALAALNIDNLSMLIGRLRAGVSAVVAEQQMRAPFAPFVGDTRKQMSIGGLSDAAPVPTVYPGLYEINQEQTRRGIAALYPFALGAAALLLLLACANTSNLLLARTMTRARDLAVRSAIGATRWRLARGLLVEAAAIAGVAALTAVFVARVGVGSLQGEQLFQSGPPLDAIALDWRVLTFVALLSTVTVVLFGLLPAMMGSRPGLAGVIATSSRATRGTRRLRAALVCAQLALAVTLLAGAGVLVRTLQQLRGIDLGLNSDGVVAFEISPARLGYTGARRMAVVQGVHDRLERAPGIESVASASPSPFWRLRSPASLKVEPVDSVPAHEVSVIVVSADYFETLQIPLRAGRRFTADDVRRGRSKENVGIVNEALARQLFGNAPAIGRHIHLSRAARGWELDRSVTIVGVVGDTRFGANLRTTGQPALYEPGTTGFRLAFFVRSPMPARDTMAAVRDAVRQVDPTLPLADAGPLGAAVDRLIPEERVLALLVAGMAVLALVLGISGVHAVVAHTIAERRREFGIRLALGATRGAVSRGVLGSVGRLAGIGLICGLMLFVGGSRLLASRVYGVSPLDPGTLAIVSALLVAAAIAGAWLPARRATRVDPVTALRAE
jgi:predicted permease